MDRIELDMDNGPIAPQAPVVYTDTPVAAAPLLTASPVQVKDIPGVTVDQTGVRRAMADEAAAVAAGFSLKPPIYQIGTLVNEMGQANFKASRAEWDALPLVGEACQKLIDQVRAEERTDILTDVPNLSMLDDGRLVITGNGGPYPVSARALEGLGFFVSPGGANYLKECPAPLRAMNYNHWFPLGFRVDKRATVKTGADGVDFEDMEKIYTPKRITVRTRKAKDGGREAWATTGPRYGAFDADKVAERIANALAGKGDARCDITYDGYKFRANVLFHTDVQPAKAVAGEIFKAGLVIRTADDGSGSINVSTQLHRNLCLNLLILDMDNILVGKRRHSGKAETIEEKINEHLATAEDKLSYFVRAWDAGTQENILDRYDLSNPRDVFAGLVLNKVVTVPGVKSEDLIGRLFRAWEVEPGYSKTSFINAVTRCAHSESWEDWSTVDDIESTAGSLLFAKVWDAVPPKARTVDQVLGGF